MKNTFLSMKKSDILFFLFVIALFLPFFISDTIYEWYKSFNAIHGMVMSFVKFAILATLGEMLGLRISTGVYHNKTFGIIPRMVIWGVLGMGINMAMIIFSKGTPIFLEYMGLEYASTLMNGDFCLAKFLVALAISVTMNSIFAPVFMTLHKITDTHIGNCGGSIKALSTPIPMTRIFTGLNWAVLWSFVFKKTIREMLGLRISTGVYHNKTFGIIPRMVIWGVLGVLLAIAAKKK